MRTSCFNFLTHATADLPCSLLVLLVDDDNKLPEVRANGRVFDEVSIHCEYIVTSGVVTNSRVDTTAE